MLIEKEAFQKLEDELKKQGVLERFEKENGPILGRVMITLTEPPANLGLEALQSPAYAFSCSFDFYDTSIGIIMDIESRKFLSGLWVTEQVDGAEPPSKDWVEFFITKLLKHSDEKGFGVPIYSFVNDTNDMTLVPNQA